jgi:hypothetical protein
LGRQHEGDGIQGGWSYFHPVRRFADTTGILSASVMFDRTFPEDRYASASIWYTNRQMGMNGNLLKANMRLTPISLLPHRPALYAAYVKRFGSGNAFSTDCVFAPE